MVRPGMSDGRAFTSYKPSCELNAAIQKAAKAETSSEYRQFLQVNADELIKKMNTKQG